MHSLGRVECFAAWIKVSENPEPWSRAMESFDVLIAFGLRRHQRWSASKTFLASLAFVAGVWFSSVKTPWQR
jgi:hypothetical protein